MTLLKTFMNQLLGLLLVSVVLAAVVLLAYTGHIDATDAFGVVMALLTVTGATGIVVLVVQSIPNSTLVSHGVFAAMLVASVVILTLHNVFDSSEAVPFFSALIAGAAAGVGGNSFANALNRSRGNGPSPAPVVPPVGSPTPLGNAVPPA